MSDPEPVPATPSKREEILIALQTALAASGLAIARNLPLGDIEEDVFSSLRDGDNELMEEFFYPPVYEFELRPVLTLLVQSAMPETGADPDDAAARDTALDGAIEAIGQVFDAIETMPDQVTDWRMLPPQFDTHEILGAAGMKGCEITFEIEYWSSRRQG
jgi:hypothetical protein